MASSPETGPRHVGRVIDPLAREDGELEPALELESEIAGADRGSEPSEDVAIAGESNALSDELPRSHPVRERMLARAAAARGVASEPGASPAESAEAELEAIGRKPRSRSAEVARQLTPSPGSRPPSAPVAGRSRRPLSPNLIAVFGTLLGLATVASLVALMVGIDPRRHPLTMEVPAAASTESEAQAVAPAPTVKRRARQKLPGPWRVRDARNDPGVRLIEGKIGLSPFLKAVEDAGIKKDEAYRVLNALKDVKDLDKCQKNDRFFALVERSSAKITAFEYVAGDEEVFQARAGADGLLSGRKLDLKVQRAQVNGAIRFEGGDFELASAEAGFDPGLGKVLSKAFDGHTGIEELTRGDRLRVVVQEITVLGEFARYAGVEAVEVVFADPRMKPIRIYYFQGAQSRGYFDDKGRQPYEGGWRKPVKDAAMTSPFNPKRLHPILKKVMPHNGMDFGAPAGTPVGASSYGTVSYLAYAGASGNLVKIEHPGGIETGYAHLSRFAEGLKLGDRVKRLQLIGYVGSTGRSTGPHLHFSAEKDDKFFDPQSLNLDGMRVLSKEERDLFLQIKQKYDRLLDAVALPDALPPPAPPPVASVAAPDGQRPGLAGEDEGFEPAPTGPAPIKVESATAPASRPAAAGPSNAVYLTDKELMKQQAMDDDGEVAQ